MLRAHTLQEACAFRVDACSTTSLFGLHSPLSSHLPGRQSRGPACSQATKPAAACPGGSRTNLSSAVVDRPQDPPSQELSEVSSVPRPTGATDGPWAAQAVNAVEEAQQLRPAGESCIAISESTVFSAMLHFKLSNMVHQESSSLRHWAPHV